MSRGRQAGTEGRGREGGRIRTASDDDDDDDGDGEVQSEGREEGGEGLPSLPAM